MPLEHLLLDSGRLTSGLDAGTYLNLALTMSRSFLTVPYEYKPLFAKALLSVINYLK